MNTKYHLPHDIGMISLISLNKGCYPGQEIHARLDSRSKPKKKMVVLSTGDVMQIGKHPLSDGSSVKNNLESIQGWFTFIHGNMFCGRVY